MDIMAILGVTTEYRFGTIRPTFAAIPRRPQVLLAKAVVFGGLSFAVVAIVSVVAVVAALSAPRAFAAPLVLVG